jgi:hypothetical protein
LAKCTHGQAPTNSRAERLGRKRGRDEEGPDAGKEAGEEIPVPAKVECVGLMVPLIDTDSATMSWSGPADGAAGVQMHKPAGWLVRDRSHAGGFSRLPFEPHTGEGP